MKYIKMAGVISMAGGNTSLGGSPYNMSGGNLNAMTMSRAGGGKMQGGHLPALSPLPLTGGRGRKTRHHRKHATKSYAGGRKRKSRKAKRSRRKY